MTGYTTDALAIAVHRLGPDPRGPGVDGPRFRWHYTVTVTSPTGGSTTATGSDLEGPVDETDALSTLGSFLGAWAESRSRRGEAGESADLFPAALWEAGEDAGVDWELVTLELSELGNHRGPDCDHPADDFCVHCDPGSDGYVVDGTR